MSSDIKPPVIDRRTASELYRRLRRMVPHYTPEWPAEKEDDPGLALVDAFSVIAAGVIQQLNRAPENAFIEFLNLLGIQLLPARPAGVPVQFKVNPKLDEPVPVRAPAQCSAPGTVTRAEDLPFETEEDLLAMPSLLLDLYAVDPETDAIYRPPPKFLKLDAATQPLPSYQTVSFSAAGSRTFQLDRVEQLEPGDILRIRLGASAAAGAPMPAMCCPPGLTAPAGLAALYLEIAAKPSGRIVPLIKPLPQAFPPGTVVEKVTDFVVFDSMNLQQHVLFLGHADLLNLESAAEIELRVKHLSGTGTNLSSLALAWEYGVKAEVGDGADWRPFEVLADISVGFRADGSITLRKPVGEIIETEIAGSKSRWIRARVRDPIPAAPPPRLPRLDEITFTVKSSGTPGAPDAMLYNEAVVELPGRPFGPEPRQFDRFYIGSEEVFSKKLADVTMNVTLLAPNLASPASVQFEDTVHVFSCGPGGRLVEVTLPADGSATWSRSTHKAIEGAAIARDSTPAALATDTKPERIFVVVRDEKGQIHERFYDADKKEWRWIPLQAPDPGAILDPAIVLDASDNPKVFVVGADFKLYSMTLQRDTGAAGNWADHGSPQDARGVTLPAASSPAVARLDGTTLVYLCDTKGKIHEFSVAGGWIPLTTTAVADFDERPEVGGPQGPCTPAPSPGPRVVVPLRSRVFIALYKVGGQIAKRLAFRSDQKKLIALRIGDVGPPEEDLTPDGTTTAVPDLASAPSGILLGGTADPGKSLHLFVRDCANQLWYRSPDRWLRLDRSNDLRLAPSVLRAKSGALEFVRVFIAQADRMAELRFRYESDTAAGGPLRTLVLEDTASAADDDYKGKLICIAAGPGSGDATVRAIEAYGGPHRVLRLEDLELSWPQLPDDQSRYRVLEPYFADGKSSAIPTNNEIKLQTPGQFTDVKNRLDGNLRLLIQLEGAAAQVRDITAVDDASETVFVNADWDPLPIAAPAYKVYEVLHAGTVPADARNAIALGPSSVVSQPPNSAEDFYRGAELRIIGGTAQGQVGVVRSYSGAAQVALLENALNPPPDDTSLYEILVPVAWARYEDPEARQRQPQLAWEYWNGSGWLRISDIDDRTGNFLRSGKVTFRMPADTEPTQVGGQENSWIRARLVGGDYGREVFSVLETVVSNTEKTYEVKSTKEGIEPPLILTLTISYTLTEQQFPERCIAYNNLSFLDQTDACKTPGKHFEPFVPLEDQAKAVYLGFEKPLKDGPIGILFVADELRTEEPEVPMMLWTYRSDNAWKDVRAEDGARALAVTGILRFQIQEEFQLRSLFDQSRYWIRGSLARGDYLEQEKPRLLGVFPNSVMTTQAGTRRDEILGSSNGDAGQSFLFLFLPAAEGEPPSDWSIIGTPEIRVRESLTPEEKADLVATVGEEAVKSIDVLGEVQTWVLWTEVDHFFQSSADSRHYRLDRARGRIRFGDGRRGMIPPADVDNIRAFVYRAGGGDQGNVGSGEVNTLVTAVAGIESVLNPIEAGGGGDRASVEEMLEIGPARLSHKSRAVTPEDFEWLAREASREVARARCRPNFEVSADPSDQGRARAGWVTVYIVPDKTDNPPRPSFQLQRSVRRYLEQASDAGLAASGRIAVRAPRYVPVSVEADVVVTALDLVAAVEKAVDDELRRFLHPLKGGPEERGWDFGRPVAASDIFVRLEALRGVDHVENLRLRFKGRTDRDLARIEPDELIAWAEPRIRIRPV